MQTHRHAKNEITPELEIFWAWILVSSLLLQKDKLWWFDIYWHILISPMYACTNTSPTAKQQSKVLALGCLFVCPVCLLQLYRVSLSQVSLLTSEWKHFVCLLQCRLSSDSKKKTWPGREGEVFRKESRICLSGQSACTLIWGMWVLSSSMTASQRH